MARLNPIASIQLILFILLSSSGISTHAEVLTVGVGADRYSKVESYLTFAKWNPNTWITEPPIFRTNSQELAPGLIERWENNGNTYRLHVRKGVKFHNGAELNAAAIIDALKIYALNRSEILRIDPNSYKIIDNYTFEIRTNHKTVHFISFLTHPFIAMYAPSTDEINAPVGTGPFIFKDYKRNQYIEVIRNENYWREKPPNNRVIYRFIADAQARLFALLNGEVDIIYPVDNEILLSLQPKGKFKIITSTPNNYITLTVNIRGDPPFELLNDINIRHAIAYAINREVIANALYLGKAVPAKTLLSPDFMGLGDDFLESHPFNPNRSNSLLDEAGWVMRKDGYRYKDNRLLQLRLVSGWPNATDLKPIPELLQQMFKKIGVSVELIQTDDDGVYYGNYMGPGKGDLFLEKASNTGLTPDWLLYMLYHSDTPWSVSGYKWALPGAKFDALINEAQSTTVMSTVIEKVRDAQKVLIDEQVSTIPIIFVPDIYLARPNIDFDPQRDSGYVNFGYAKKSK